MVIKFTEEKIQRIDSAIKLMEWVDENKTGSFNMRVWQSGLHDNKTALKTLEEVSTCGSVCCFAGYLAVSDEFTKAGGTVNPENGAPVFREYYNSNAVSEYFGISQHDAELLTCYNDGYPLARDTYGCSISEVTPKDVIKQLKVLKFKYTI